MHRLRCSGIFSFGWSALMWWRVHSSVFNTSKFGLILENRLTQFGETLQEASIQRPLFFFGGGGGVPIGKQRWPPWPIFSWDYSDLSALAEQEESTRLPLSISNFSGQTDSKDGCPGLWLADTFYCNIV